MPRKFSQPRAPAGAYSELCKSCGYQVEETRRVWGLPDPQVLKSTYTSLPLKPSVASNVLVSPQPRWAAFRSMLRADLVSPACRESKEANVSPRPSGRGCPKWPMSSSCPTRQPPADARLFLSRAQGGGGDCDVRGRPPGGARPPAPVHLPAGGAALQLHLSLLQGGKSGQRH